MADASQNVLFCLNMIQLLCFEYHSLGDHLDGIHLGQDGQTQRRVSRTGTQRGWGTEMSEIVAKIRAGRLTLFVPL